MIGNSFSLILNPLSATFTFSQLNSLGVKRSFQQSTQRSVACSAIGNPIVRSPQFQAKCNWEIDTIISESEFSSLQALIALYQKRILNNAGVLPYVVLGDFRIQWSEKGDSEADATKFGSSFEVSGGVLSYFAYYLVTLIVPRDWFEALGNYSYRVKLKAVEVGPLGPGYGLYDAPYPAFDPTTLPSEIPFGGGDGFIYGLTTSGEDVTTGFGANTTYRQQYRTENLYYWQAVQSSFFPCASYTAPNPPYPGGDPLIIGPIEIPKDWGFYLDTFANNYTDTAGNCYILPDGSSRDFNSHLVGELYKLPPGIAWFDPEAILITSGQLLCVSGSIRTEYAP